MFLILIPNNSVLFYIPLIVHREEMFLYESNKHYLLAGVTSVLLRV